MIAGKPMVEIVVEDEGWDVPSLQASADEGATIAMRAAGLNAAGWTISVLAADDARIAALNETHRGRTGPTNVLSWPALDLAPARCGARPKSPPEPAMEADSNELGDIALARETVAREAQELGISVDDHVTHLILHGVLHLLGYDHETDADAALMENLESRALAEAGRPDPYALDRISEESA